MVFEKCECPNIVRTKKKIRKNLLVYLLKIARITLIIAPTTTTHPAIIVMIPGMAGTAKVPSIMPEPTARATITPTIHVNTAAKLFSAILFTSFLFLLFFLCGKV